MTDVYVERRDGKIVVFGPHLIVGKDGQPLDPQEVLDDVAVLAELDAARTSSGLE